MRHRNLPLDLAALFASLIIIGASLLVPDVVAELRYYLLAAVMFTVGIPHGAVDHIISSRLFSLDNTIGEQIKFYVPYLLMMLLMGLIWYASPKVGFAVFVACTVYHFGQADFTFFKIPQLPKNLLYISRGLMVLGLLVFIHPNDTYPIMNTIAGLDLSSHAFWKVASPWIGTATAIQHFMILFAIIYKYGKHLEVPSWYPVTDALLVSLLLAFSDPISGFAVYFAFWHSMGHIHELQLFLSSRSKQWSITEFYKHSWLFTVISIAGLAILYLLNDAFGSTNQMVSILLILISLLTLPHMLVVEKMFRSTDYSAIKNKY